MPLYRAFDASRPPMTAYPGCQAVMLYLGGPTPHVATRDEWLRFQGLAQFPIWVGDQAADAAQHGEQCVQAMADLGWERGAPFRRGVIIDEETTVDGPWIDTFANTVYDGGYETFVYGSLFYVMKNPPRSGYLVADWNNVPQIPPYHNVVGCQYEANIEWDGTQVDLSVLSEEMLTHAGYGPRK